MAPIVRGGAISGPPDSAAEQIQRYINAGAQEANVALRAPWDDAVLDQYLEQLPVLRKLS
jgi:alkanesulfonate monooxygenase SsuD/methylene tetrahydromethanopterin reductase-like flavin-dependent oxidoreductase (luciferase family)